MPQHNTTHARIGILMLETQFPRILGDIGNPDSWPFSVLYQMIKGASPDEIVRQSSDVFTNRFIEAADFLIKQGADGITTSCGFMARFQKELAAAIAVPFVSSSLLQIPMVQAILPQDKRVAILTISEASLSIEQLKAVGAPKDIAIKGTDDGQELSRVILNNEHALDIDKARADIINAGQQLIQENPNTGAIVLECTNMTPYAADLHAALGIPIFSIYDLICWFQAGLSPRKFS